MTAKSLRAPIGYAWLLERGGVRAMRPHHTSFIEGSQRVTETEEDGRFVVDLFPESYLRDDTPLGHLLFAVKYDGLDLAILRQVLPAIADELTRAVRAAPTSKALRQLWFLSEWFTGQTLDLADAQRLKYAPLADPARYYTVPGERSPRHAIMNNLLGTPAWSPLVRRSERLAAADREPLAARARAITAGCEPHLLRRAVHFLYTKETKTSFALENEEIRGPKEQRFVALLQSLHRYPHFNAAMLVELQNLIVDRRFAAPGVRDVQNFIGDAASDQVYYVAPRPADVGPMMAGLEVIFRQLSERPKGGEPPIPAVIAAAIMSFSLVYIHPFEDGNGRLSRLLIHQMLARLGFAPKDLVLPISASILADRGGYDQVLRSVDLELLPLLTWEYEPEPPRWLIVEGNDAYLYAYLDLTLHAEALYRWTTEALSIEVAREIDYLERFDRALAGMSAVVDLPDRLAGLFINLVRDNGFRLSQTKRRRYFDMLRDAEIAALEGAVAAAFAGPAGAEGASPGVSEG